MYRTQSKSAKSKYRSRRRHLPRLVLALAVLLVAPAAHAMVTPMDVEAMTHEARWILEGQVTELYSAWDPGQTRIHTYVTIRVDTFYKGAYPEREFRLRVLGGEVDGVSMTISEGPSFVEGQNLVLFLGENPQSFFPVVGLAQGLFAITEDAATGQQIARNANGLTLAQGDLLEQVRRVLAEI